MFTLPSFRIMEIALLGDGFVGKTSLLRRFKGEKFDQKYRITVGADFIVKKMQYGEQHVTLKIWDVGGQPEFARLRSQYYKNTSGILVVFDLMKRSTFDSIPVWLNEVLENNNWRLVPIILLGNKNDLTKEDPREVSDAEIAEYVEILRNWGHSMDTNFVLNYYETSAKSGDNVREAFDELVLTALKTANN